MEGWIAGGMDSGRDGMGGLLKIAPVVSGDIGVRGRNPVANACQVVMTIGLTLSFIHSLINR